MTEKTLASYKQGNIKIKLLEITEVQIGSDGIETDLTDTFYLITKNRKRLLNTKWINQAKRHYAGLITSELLQTKVSF